jgi:hypothetical protein
LKISSDLAGTIAAHTFIEDGTIPPGAVAAWTHYRVSISSAPIIASASTAITWYFLSLFHLFT